MCESCGLPVLHAGRCGPCSAGSFFGHITRLRTVGPYDGTLRRILHALKYDGRRTLATELGPLLQRHSTDLLEGAHLVVPVPLHATRMRERGFNQAADLARALPLPHLDALARVVATGSQTGLSADERRRNVSRAFVPRPEPSRLGLMRAGRSMESPTLHIRDRVVVLVDDVCTTGATLEACARVLLQAGAREVRAVTVARALLAQADRRRSAPALR